MISTACRPSSSSASGKGDRPVRRIIASIPLTSCSSTSCCAGWGVVLEARRRRRPGLALCIALGRIGCFLNGCAATLRARLPSPASRPSPARPARKSSRERLSDAHRVPGPDGDGRRNRPGEVDRFPPEVLVALRDATDPIRSVVVGVETESNADRAGLKPGDRIVGVNGRTNAGSSLSSGRTPWWRKLPNWPGKPERA